MYDISIIKTQKYIDENLPELDNVHPTYAFDTRSYSRWAANELLNRLIYEDSKRSHRIEDSESINAISIIDGFISELDWYFWASTTVKTQEIFSIAKNTIQDIKQRFL